MTSLVVGPKLTPRNAENNDGFDRSGEVAGPWGTYARSPTSPFEHEKNDGPSHDPWLAAARSQPALRTRPTFWATSGPPGPPSRAPGQPAEYGSVGVVQR